MWWITKMFEGQFFFGRPYPAIVSCVVGLVSVMFVLHAFLAMRKFPANFREYHNFRGHCGECCAMRTQRSGGCRR